MHEEDCATVQTGDKTLAAGGLRKLRIAAAILRELGD